MIYIFFYLFIYLFIYCSGNLRSCKIDEEFIASIICSTIPAGAVGSLSLPSPLLPAAASNAAPFVTGAALQTLLARLVQVGTWEGGDFNGYTLVN